MAVRHLLVLPLILLLMLPACGDDSSSEPGDDLGYVTLDGGGPLNRDGFSLPADDSGPSASGQRGKFCSEVVINGQKVSLAVRIGSVMLAASNGPCSKCLGLTAGTQSMTIYSGGSPVGGGKVTIQPGKDYVFWMNYSQATQKGQFQGKTLDPSQGEGCESYTPKM